MRSKYCALLVVSVIIMSVVFLKGEGNDSLSLQVDETQESDYLELGEVSAIKGVFERNHIANSVLRDKRVVAVNSFEKEVKDFDKAVDFQSIESGFKESIEHFSDLSTKAVLSDEETKSYREMASSGVFLENLVLLLSAGPIEGDDHLEASSKEALMLYNISSQEISKGQVMRVKATNAIKDSFELNRNRDFYAYAKDILLSDNLRGEYDREIKHSIIATKLDLYKYFSKRLVGFDDYLIAGIENDNQEEIYTFLAN